MLWQGALATRDPELMRVLDQWVQDLERTWSVWSYGDPYTVALRSETRVRGTEPTVDLWWCGLLVRSFAAMAHRLPTAEGRAAARRITERYVRFFVAGWRGDTVATLEMCRAVLASDPTVRQTHFERNYFGTWNCAASTVRMRELEDLHPRLDMIYDHIKLYNPGLFEFTGTAIWPGEGSMGTDIYEVPDV
jgi:hypothetical protein